MVANLRSLFQPNTVAIVGASTIPGKLGYILAERAVSGGFPKERIFAVNPNSTEPILGLKTVRSVSELDIVPDIVVLTTPPKHVPGIARECASLGVKYLVIVTAGFSEVHTQEGDAFQQELSDAVKDSSMRIVGPNCFGIMNMQDGLDLTFGLTGVSKYGNVSILSQSGGVAAALIDRARGLGVGLNKVVTMGNAFDLSWREYLTYLGSDNTTRAILLYVEGVGSDAEGFLSALREVSEHKLVVVFKPGRSEAAAKAAATHTGSLAGNDRVFDAALRRTKAIRVDSFDEMFYLAMVANYDLPRTNQYTFLTNGGGPGVIAADRAALSGLTPAILSDETLEKLDTILPSNWSRGNPVDIIGDADRTRYNLALSVVLADKNVESVVVMYIPTAMSPPEEVAMGIIDAVNENRKNGFRKTVLVVWMGGWSIDKGQSLLREAGIPVLQNPDTASRILGHLADYRRRHEVLYQTPLAIPHIGTESLESLRTMLLEIRQTGRTLLTEAESKRVLRLANIQTNKILVARSSFDATNAAADIGYPVVVKVHAEILPGMDIALTHKSEFGVYVNLTTPFAVTDAYRKIEKEVTQKVGEESFCGVSVQEMVKTAQSHELFLGTTNDPDFGSVLIFGRGGTHVEYFGDTIMGLNQLSTAHMDHLIKQTRIYRVLQGVRGTTAVDMQSVVEVGVRLSELSTGLFDIVRSIEINPLLASPTGVSALDARIELFSENEVGSKPAIRSYPIEWMRHEVLDKDEQIILRPIDASDEEKMVAFHEKVSQEDVYHRYYMSIPLKSRLDHNRLAQRCNIDYRSHMAFVAENAEGEIVSITRLVRENDDGDYEVAFFTRTDYKGRGIARRLMNICVEWAVSEKITRIVGMTEKDNQQMRKVFKGAGFTERFDPEDHSMVLLEKSITNS